MSNNSNLTQTKSNHATENLLLHHHRMPKPPEDFYPKLVEEILPACGHSISAKDFMAGVEQLNRKLCLKLDFLEQRVLSMILTALSQADRFRHDEHIEPGLGDDTAIHSCHAPILMNEMFRRSGLLDSRQQSLEVIGMRAEMTLSCFLHDGGEILGELNSLAQRAHDSSLQESPDTERCIFKAAVQLAFDCANRGQITEFYSTIDRLRRSITPGNQHLADLHQYLDLELPDHLQGSANMFLAAFDLAEFKDEWETPPHKLFRGYAVKAVEHLQGVRHFIRFATKDLDFPNRYLRIFSKETSSPLETERPNTGPKPTFKGSIPANLANIQHITLTLAYVEGEIGYLFRHAQTDIEIKLASTIRDAIYATTIELLNIMPEVIDRSVQPRPNQSISKLELLQSSRQSDQELIFKRLVSERQTERNDQRSCHNGQTKLPAIVTRGQLMDLYAQAIVCSYQPQPGEILFNHHDLPEPLQHFPRRRWHKQFGCDYVEL